MSSDTTDRLLRNANTLNEDAGRIESAAEGEEWVEDGEDFEEDDLEGDDDVDAEAEEIARRLGDQLWAEISKAQLQAAAVSQATSNEGISTALSVSFPARASFPVHAHAVNPPDAIINDHALQQPQKKLGEAIMTMKSVLAFASKDPLASSTLSAAIVPDSNGANILDVLTRTVASGTVTKNVAKRLSHLLVSLARSDALFSSLRHSNASSIQLEQGKRKREECDPDDGDSGGRTSKRPMFVQNHYDLYTRIDEASRIIAHALNPISSPDKPIDPTVISSVQLQLHQVFLFAVTFAARGGPEMNVLQEIGGLIQVLGVLSGIQIGGPSPPVLPQHSHGSALPPHTPPPWIPPGAPPGAISPLSDIGTAVYPCLVPSCHKTFSRLYGLRAHQRVHSIDRPFRCDQCPASFARNHDLKRHTKLHDKLAWKCAGCDKIFSRRDAIKRHKNSSRTRGKGETCVDAAVLEVEVDKHGGEDEIREGRRARLWNGIAHQFIAPAFVGVPGGNPMLEEYELHPDVLRGAQAAVLCLHGLLQERVSHSLGTPSGRLIPHPSADPASGQATLASVIARAQSQVGQPVVSGPAPAIAEELASETYTAPGEGQSAPAESTSGASVSSLLLYGLSEEQTKMIEQAIATAATAAQLQAEAEAAMEEEEDFDEDDEGDEDDLDVEGTGSAA
ncbi:hypothetical protein EW146_g2989 [Bondarzewia mesenterica]|uniref:C2H2-type domain-containing protein n=1 Tax=Bondarzewia mesenterica TaxID=1095465 RepID=A0A4V3XFK8_9AGAM|nr:hypothetical protein EW146_g2989 [Bondarzewia mesenterica]